MTAKDKAKDIFVKHLESIPDYLVRNNEEARFLALTASKINIEDIINSVSYIDWGRIEYKIDFRNFFNYWQEVKQEIEKM